MEKKKNQAKNLHRSKSKYFQTAFSTVDFLVFLCDNLIFYIFCSVHSYMLSEESMIRYIAMRYSAAVFPNDYIPSRFLLLLASGDRYEKIYLMAI